MISKVVTEYRAEILADEHGNKFRAPFPDEVTRPIQYGSSVKTHAAYFLMAQLIPFERAAEYMRNQFGLTVSQGTLANILKEAHALLEPFEVLVKDILISQDILHADETGINIGGKTFWLHSASNEKWTLFHPTNQEELMASLQEGYWTSLRAYFVPTTGNPTLNCLACTHFAMPITCGS